VKQADYYCLFRNVASETLSLWKVKAAQSSQITIELSSPAQ